MIPDSYDASPVPLFTRTSGSLDPWDAAALGLIGRTARVLGFVSLMVIVGSVRYLSGWPLVSEVTTGATWTRPGRVPAGRRVRIGWSYWPIWQRAVTRWIVLTLAVAGGMWPLWTAVATGTAILGTAGAAGVTRYRRRRPPFHRIPFRVRVVRPIGR